MADCLLSWLNIFNYSYLLIAGKTAAYLPAEDNGVLLLHARRRRITLLVSAGLYAD